MVLLVCASVCSVCLFFFLCSLSLLLSALCSPQRFLSNFASPQFRSFVPRMSKSLHFEAEFVTYKWPVWLRRQEEKQRIIWGYKILFLGQLGRERERERTQEDTRGKRRLSFCTHALCSLDAFSPLPLLCFFSSACPLSTDVLFPLSVRRVIYIDADQVVRGDIKELWDLPLENGAPYAYTPFCFPPGNNAATEGFRFWNSGYWRDHLRGKPYHISALYVVDLDTFRALRAGDALRGIYDQLSADPGSLANLDQDLVSCSQKQK